MNLIKKNLVYFLLGVIVALGLFVRLYNVGSLPAILNRDEAALAYNAYLLDQTGLDEWSQPWSLTLESFGDFKLVGYPAAVVGLFQFLPVSDLTVRLPSVLAGTALILLSFWWARKLGFKNEVGLVLGLVISLTPIFWFYSRIAFEANLALTFLVAGLGLLLFYQRKSTDLAGLACLLVAAITYNTPLLLLPFIMVVLPLQRGIKDWQKWLLPVMGLLLIFGGVFSQLISLTSQKSAITIFSDETVWMESINYRQKFSGLAQTILGHKYVYFGQLMAIRFVRSFSPIFMVTNGGSHPWHSIPNGGHIIWLVYLAGMLGIITTAAGQLREKMVINHDKLLLYFLVVSLLPSVITVDAPHATRSLFFFFIFTIFAVKGLVWLYQWQKARMVKRFFWPVLVVVVLLSGLNYGQNYFIYYALHQPDSTQIGYDYIIDLATQRYPDEQIAIVDDKGFHYILTAWYLKTDPELFHQTIVKQLPDAIGFRYGERFDRFHFIGRAADSQIEGERVVLSWEDDQWRIMEK